jgi:hypothetical protein
MFAVQTAFFDAAGNAVAEGFGVEFPLEDGVAYLRLNGSGTARAFRISGYE